jgi:hypothetical protein
LKPVSLAALSLALSSVLVPGVARAVPEDPGLYSSVSETDSIQVGPSVVQATVCVPDSTATGPRPILALATSSVETRDVLDNLCLHLATYGFIVAVPDLGFANTDGASIGQTLLDTLAFFKSENVRQGSRFFGRIDPLHEGVVGYNTGAMGAIFAATEDDTLSAAILLDPDDINGDARSVASRIVHVPVLMIRGDPNVCNGEDSFQTVYQAMTGPRSTIHVDDSKACDAEQPATTQCQVTCGLVRDFAAQRFLRYETAYAAYFVGCNLQMRTYVDGASYQADVVGTIIVNTDQQNLPSTCGPYVVPDAGPPDGGADAGPGAETGCGCRASSNGGDVLPVLISGCLILLGLVARRRISS